MTKPDDDAVLHAFLDGLDGKPAKVQVLTCIIATMQVLNRVDPKEAKAQMLELGDLLERVGAIKVGREH